MVKTLYISDLDGTLLNGGQRVSEYSGKIISALVEKGAMFTYATARSFVTASVVTANIPIKVPVILNNGVRIADGQSGKVIVQKRFDEGKFFSVLSRLTEMGIAPLVYYSLDGQDRFSYLPELVSKEINQFLAPKKNDPRNTPVDSEEKLYAGSPYYFVCIGEDGEIFSAYEKLSAFCSCVTYKDIYTGYRWLEIMPDGANKASAALELKQMLEAERLVVFGDGGNDLSMFEAADECYAVANADVRLKERATAVIDSNDDDGVARWLLKNADF